MSRLTHIDEHGNAHMVDVSGKNITRREARARAVVCMQPSTLAMILNGEHSKGDVLGVARIAGIQAAKKTADLIPLCHPLALTSVSVEFSHHDDGVLTIEAACRVDGKTGVEMEALTAVSVAALTIYDMCKAVEKGIVIEQVKLLEKTGGKSGDWQAATPSGEPA